MRVQLGSLDVSRVPSSIEVSGRIVPVTVTQPKWFDLPMTREESIQCGGNKININFGASVDPGGVNMIDCVQVWTKSKEAFGWSEDGDDFTGAAGVSSSLAHTDSEDTGAGQLASMTPVDKVIVTTLDTLEAAIVVSDPASVSSAASSSALEVATRLLVAAGPLQTQAAARSVVAALHQSRASCHAHTDSALLRHATQVKYC